MTDTGKNALRSRDELQKQKTPPMDSKQSAEGSEGANYQLANLSLRTAKRLEACMESMAKDESVEGVKAICLCASELNKLMKLNLQFYREGI